MGMALVVLVPPVVDVVELVVPDDVVLNGGVVDVVEVEPFVGELGTVLDDGGGVMIRKLSLP